MAKAVFAAMELPEQIEFIPMPELLQGKYQYYTKANIDKLRLDGYDKPTTSLEDAVKDYIQNYLTKNQYLCADNY